MRHKRVCSLQNSCKHSAAENQETRKIWHEPSSQQQQLKRCWWFGGKSVVCFVWFLGGFAVCLCGVCLSVF
jgi:hypothetical protein